MAADQRLVEKLVRKNRLYKGRAVNFRVDEVRLPNGKRAVREFLDHPGAVAAVPFLNKDTIVMVRQYRHPVGEVTLEIPAGKLDGNAGLMACVRRELHEETGFTARRIRKLASYWPTPAFANELLHVFIAQGLRPGTGHPDDDEFLDVVKMPFRKALALVKNGKIKDSKTVIALTMCALWVHHQR